MGIGPFVSVYLNVPFNVAARAAGAIIVIAESRQNPSANTPMMDPRVLVRFEMIFGSVNTPHRFLRLSTFMMLLLRILRCHFGPSAGNTAWWE